MGAVGVWGPPGHTGTGAVGIWGPPGMAGTAAETGTAALVLRRLATYLVFWLVLESRTRRLALILVGDGALRTGVV